MFTVEQIKTAHSKVKSGADFPNYIRDLEKLGVTGYETYVRDGHSVFFGHSFYTTRSDAKYPILVVANDSNKSLFINELKKHQQGKTDYMTFCRTAAEFGVEKWVVDIEKMTCIYLDKSGHQLLVEQIPTTDGNKD